MKPTNHSQRLAGLILGQDLASWVAARRTSGAGWDRIATELAVATEGDIVVTGQTMKRWYADISVAA